MGGKTKAEPTAEQKQKKKAADVASMLLKSNILVDEEVLKILNDLEQMYANEATRKYLKPYAPDIVKELYDIAKREGVGSAVKDKAIDLLAYFTEEPEFKKETGKVKFGEEKVASAEGEVIAAKPVPFLQLVPTAKKIDFIHFDADLGYQFSQSFTAEQNDQMGNTLGVMAMHAYLGEPNPEVGHAFVEQLAGAVGVGTDALLDLVVNYDSFSTESQSKIRSIFTGCSNEQVQEVLNLLNQGEFKQAYDLSTELGAPFAEALRQAVKAVTMTPVPTTVGVIQMGTKVDFVKTGKATFYLPLELSGYMARNGAFVVRENPDTGDISLEYTGLKEKIAELEADLATIPDTPENAERKAALQEAIDNLSSTPEYGYDWGLEMGIGAGIGLTKNQTLEFEIEIERDALDYLNKKGSWKGVVGKGTIRYTNYEGYPKSVDFSLYGTAEASITTTGKIETTGSLMVGIVPQFPTFLIFGWDWINRSLEKAEKGELEGFYQDENTLRFKAGLQIAPPKVPANFEVGMVINPLEKGKDAIIGGYAGAGIDLKNKGILKLTLSMEKPEIAGKGLGEGPATFITIGFEPKIKKKKKEKK